jgi:ATP-dependent Lon protease
VKDVILPAENRQNVEEDLTADQTDGVDIHYASRIEDVLAVALPKSVSEEKKDEAVREGIIEHAEV